MNQMQKAVESIMTPKNLKLFAVAIVVTVILYVLGDFVGEFVYLVIRNLGLSGHRQGVTWFTQAILIVVFQFFFWKPSKKTNE